MLVPSADVDLSAWGSRSVGLRMSMTFWYSGLICASAREVRLYKFPILVSMQHKSCEEFFYREQTKAQTICDLAAVPNVGLSHADIHLRTSSIATNARINLYSKRRVRANNCEAAQRAVSAIRLKPGSCAYSCRQHSR